MTVVAFAQRLAVVRSESRAWVLNLGALHTEPSPLVLEGAALEIWDRIDGSATVADIVEDLAHGLPSEAREQVSRDVPAFIDALVERGVVVWGSSVK
ncbi:PqqD family protein [Demequina sediminicola]|uniref:PqqD family protein n=1 Tax=Demequina sediminicola TaxID=1095026 RepID=UPI000785C1FE|nr:PqqD family protein [Demequina sediminicola]